MARKTVFTAERANLIVKCISLGYTLTDTAYAADISTETIRRWREKYPDFNRRVIEASNRQWDHPEALITYHNPNYRKYKRRKTLISPYYGAKVVKDTSKVTKQPLEALKPAKKQYIYGLPVRHGTIKDLSAKVPRYYNASNGSVEWVDEYPLTGRLILRRCPLDVYRRKIAERQERQVLPILVVA